MLARNLLYWLLSVKNPWQVIVSHGNGTSFLLSQHAQIIKYNLLSAYT